GVEGDRARRGEVEGAEIEYPPRCALEVSGEAVPPGALAGKGFAGEFMEGDREHPLTREGDLAGTRLLREECVGVEPRLPGGSEDRCLGRVPSRGPACFRANHVAVAREGRG